MSFRLFIYYCALGGGWAAFVAWGLVELLGVLTLSSVYLKAMLTGALLGALVAAAIGLVDALLNARGFQRVLRTATCFGLGLLGGAVGGLVGQALESLLGLPLFFGWIVAGVLIGASIGIFDLMRALA